MPVPVRESRMRAGSTDSKWKPGADSNPSPHHPLTSPTICVADRTEDADVTVRCRPLTVTWLARSTPRTKLTLDAYRPSRPARPDRCVTRALRLCDRQIERDRADADVGNTADAGDVDGDHLCCARAGRRACRPHPCRHGCRGCGPDRAGGTCRRRVPRRAPGRSTVDASATAHTAAMMQ